MYYITPLSCSSKGFHVFEGSECGCPFAAPGAEHVCVRRRGSNTTPAPPHTPESLPGSHIWSARSPMFISARKCILSLLQSSCAKLRGLVPVYNSSTVNEYKRHIFFFLPSIF